MEGLSIVIVFVACLSAAVVYEWIDGKRKERRAVAREETLRRLLEASPESAEKVLELIRRGDDLKAAAFSDGLLTSGLAVGAGGFGLMIFLAALKPGQAYYLGGLMPVFIGAALVAYGFLRRRRAA